TTTPHSAYSDPHLAVAAAASVSKHKIGLGFGWVPATDLRWHGARDRSYGEGPSCLDEGEVLGVSSKGNGAALVAARSGRGATACLSGYAAVRGDRRGFASFDRGAVPSGWEETV